MAIDQSLELLKSERANLVSRLSALERAIHELEKNPSNGQPGISVGNDDFKGMKKVEAVVKLLGRLGRPAHLYKEILPALERGGCTLGEQEQFYAKNLKIAVRMNSKPQHQLAYDEHNEMVSLRNSQAPKKRKMA